jgi:hypothetical protein
MKGQLYRCISPTTEYLYLGIIGEGKICLILDTVDLGHVSYYKVLFDGRTGYVRADSLQALEQ